MKKVMKFLMNHRKFVTFISVLAPLILVIISAKVQEEAFLKEFPSIEMAYYVSQIIAALFMIAGTVVAVWQYYLSSRGNIIQTQLIQVQKAIDLAEYYKDNILYRYTVINYVYNQSGITEILDKIKPCDMNTFDNIELHRLLSEDDIKKLKDIQGSQAYAEAILKADTIYNLKLHINGKVYRGKREGERILEIDAQTLLVSFLSNIHQELLNSTEFFSMHFCHNTADESVVYRSLHQTYLQIIQELYYSIASRNISPESKYFTNIVELYHKWAAKNKEEIESINKEKQFRHGTTIDLVYDENNKK